MKRQKTKQAKRATPRSAPGVKEGVIVDATYWLWIATQRKGCKPKVTTFTIDGPNDPRRSVSFAPAF